MEQTKLWILLRIFDHGAHLADEGLNLFLSHIQLLSKLSILPFELIVLILQLLLMHVLLLDLLIALLLTGGHLPLPLNLGRIVLCRLVGFLSRHFYLVQFLLTLAHLRLPLQVFSDFL